MALSWGVRDSETGEAVLATSSFQWTRKEWEFPGALPGHCESHVVNTALDLVLSFQVRHVAGIFPVDGRNYVSDTQIGYRSLASGSNLGKGNSELPLTSEATPE